MQPMIIVLPVREGKREALQQFAAELSGPRRAELDKAQMTITKETWFLQPTPMGDLLAIYFESPSPMNVAVNLAVSEEPFDLWFKTQLFDITGYDMNNPPQTAPPEMIMQWQKPV
jgi:hypothetical protein